VILVICGWQHTMDRSNHDLLHSLIKALPSKINQ
jgi:hypothetical protein